jgi:hypothetical protein
MVVGKMKKRLKEAGITLISAAVFLIGPHNVSAHILDERPGLGTGMTIALSIFWVAVVAGIVFLVRRLMRPHRGATGNRSEKENNGKKD